MPACIAGRAFCLQCIPARTRGVPLTPPPPCPPALARFYDPQTGAVIIDGQNIADVTQVGARPPNQTTRRAGWVGGGEVGRGKLDRLACVRRTQPGEGNAAQAGS